MKHTSAFCEGLNCLHHHSIPIGSRLEQKLPQNLSHLVTDIRVSAGYFFLCTQTSNRCPQGVFFLNREARRHSKPRSRVWRLPRLPVSAFLRSLQAVAFFLISSVGRCRCYSFRRMIFPACCLRLQVATDPFGGCIRTRCRICR